jgi:hypothetical protein
MQGRRYGVPSFGNRQFGHGGRVWDDNIRLASRALDLCPGVAGFGLNVLAARRALKPEFTGHREPNFS